jgi:lipopolysaccharide/colanic/teichoic acid biosynthesis glycosyltransferase
MTPKRLFDITVAFVALLAFVPVFLIIALAIKLDSGGPVFYRARRIGQAGRPFQMYKFRTMGVGADRAGPALTYQDDPRVTPVGQWLRHVRLDELPQLLNVLRGEMSLVGPRPEAPEYVQHEQAIWRQVLSVRPGICGLAQLEFAVDEVSLLNNQSTVDQDYRLRILPVKLQLDLNYVDKQSLLLDLKLLAQTFLLLVRQERHLPRV